MYGSTEEDPIIVSMLSQYAYCPRRCAIMFLEQTYEDNEYTLRGQELHERIDEPGWLTWSGCRTERALPVWSDSLGLQGKCDAVIFQEDGTPYPVEYKSGKRGYKRSDDIQLCAQALCLEEMFGTPVPQGAIYYFSSRKRRNVILDEALRQLTRRTIQEVRQLLSQMEMPEPVNDRRCPDCSVVGICLPEAVAQLRLCQVSDLFSIAEREEQT